MARSNLEPVGIPRLRQKIRLLYLAQTGIADDAALGRLFRSKDEPEGLTGKAVRNWFFGEGSRDADMLPGNRFDRLVEIFESRLPGGRSTAEVRSLLFAEQETDLVLAFFVGAPPTAWISLVVNAPHEAMRVVRAGRPGFFDVTTRRRYFDALEGEVDVPIEERFRLEIAPRRGWLTMLQWGADGWYGLDLADDVMTLERGEAAVVAPLAPPYFIESKVGARRYMAIHTDQPLPPDLAATLKTSVNFVTSLATTTLDRLAYLAAGPSGFHMNALDVMFVDPQAAG